VTPATTAAVAATITTTTDNVGSESNQDESILREKALKQILENSMKEKKKTP